MSLTCFRSPLSVLEVAGAAHDPRRNGCFAFESGTDLDFVMSAPGMRLLLVDM